MTSETILELAELFAHIERESGKMVLAIYSEGLSKKNEVLHARRCGHYANQILDICDRHQELGLMEDNDA